MRVLDEHTAAVVRSLCELIVPGSGRVGPEVYIDALLARMPDEQRDGVLAAITALEQPAARGTEGLAEHQFTPEFMLVRALACEAYYSDFVAPGAPGPADVLISERRIRLVSAAMPDTPLSRGARPLRDSSGCRRAALDGARARVAASSPASLSWTWSMCSS